VRAELAAIALDLFAEHGFEETTVEEIARAAGLTKRSFFRYFPAKEDAVFAGVDVTGEQVVRDLLARPAGEAPWQSLRAVLLESERRIHASGQAVAGLKLIESTPSLRARVHEKRSQWRRQVSKALRDRPDADLDAFTADLLTNAATAALDTASQAWLRSEGTADRTALLDRAFDLLGPAAGDRSN
jgi:AcrR family transcriptional regulator